MTKNKTRTISTRVTRSFHKVLGKYLKADAHVTVGDFLRDAAREKIRRDTPELYDRMFEEEAEKALSGEI